MGRRGLADGALWAPFAAEADPSWVRFLVQLGLVWLVSCVLPGASSPGDVLYISEGNNLRRLDLRRQAEAPEAEILIEHAPRGDDPSQAGASRPERRDINGTICFLPDGSGRFVAGEDTGQPGTPPGWGVFSREGEQVGKLTATYQVPGAEPHGCAFDPDGRLFTGEVGNAGFGTPRGQLILWFPPFDGFPGPPGAYPDTDERSTNFCKIAVDIGTAGGVAVDGDGRVYVASAGRGAIYRFAPPFPTAPTAGGGCSERDDTGAPLADEVHREVFYRGLYTFSGLAWSDRGSLYASSVFTGEIVELDLAGGFLRKILEPAGFLPPFETGNPMGLATDSSGTLYYADLDLVWSFPSIGPGPNGKVRRIRFDRDGEPLPPEILLESLAFPDGLGVDEQRR